MKIYTNMCGGCIEDDYKSTVIEAKFVKLQSDTIPAP
jgi:hypothetical protein